MAKYTYLYSRPLAKNGVRYDLLTSNEYPWMNIQVLEFPEEDYERVRMLMQERHEMMAVAPGRTDFCCIQAGGGTPEHPTIEVNAENWREVGEALRDCLKEAAVYWAENGERLKKEVQDV